jgi:hypothetical protein
MQSITTRVAQIFWGLAIIAVDIRAGRFDVLPDFVGYILVALGAAGLVGWSAQFQTVRLLSWVLVGFPVALMIFSGSILKLIWLVNVVLDGALMWFLLGGIMAFSESRSRKEWISQASTYRWAYAGLLAVGVLTSFIAAALPGVAKLLGFVTFVATLIVVALILYLLHQVKGEAAAQSSPVTQSSPEGQSSPVGRVTRRCRTIRRTRLETAFGMLPKRHRVH